jgi:hypothetical protein
MEDTKRSNSISEELDLSEIKKVKKSPREEAKEKAENEFKKQKDEQANLFKQSLNKEKSFFKEMENFEVIAEANSTDELSTVKQSLISGKNLEGEPKGKIESLIVDKQKSDEKIKNSDINFGNDSKEGSAKHTQKDGRRGSMLSKAKPESVIKVTEDSEVSNIKDDQKENASAEGEESEKEEQSESEISDQEIEYEKPPAPLLKKSKYFKKLKNKKNFENKVLLVNYQYQGDY